MMGVLVLAGLTNTLVVSNYIDWWCRCAHMCAVMLCLSAACAALANTTAQHPEHDRGRVQLCIVPERGNIHITCLNT